MKKQSVRGKDRQRSKVYAWEEVASKGAWKVPTFQTLEQCQAWLTPIWRRERGRYGRARVGAPSVERPSWGQRRALAHSNMRITLPRTFRNPWMLLHEAAHLLTPRDEAHGPRFVGCLIGLLCRHAGYRAEDLMEAADEMGVAYYLRSIGHVPVVTLASRLLNVLPATEMDAAIALDVTWRQVRGASIRLIERKQARWLRGKLIPLNQVEAP